MAITRSNRLSITATVVAFALASPSVATAQAGGGSSGGMLSDVLDFSAATSRYNYDRTAQEWLRYVVLWRVPPLPRMTGSRPTYDTVALKAAALRFREQTRAAEDRGRNHLFSQRGSLVLRAEVSRWNSDTLFVGERQYLVPRRDSALVVLVDASDTTGSTHRVVAEAYIPAGLPDDARDKTWRSGDTTFSVRSRREFSDVLREMLRTNPVVRAFIDSAEVGLPPRRTRRPPPR